MPGNTMTESPASVKSLEEPYMLSLQPSHDHSIEFGTQVNHANSIFEASLDLYNHSAQHNIVSQTGFNNPTIYPASSSIQPQPKNIDEAVKGNRLLRYCQKTNFIEELQKEDELSNLLVELMVLFNQKVFGEIVYVIHTIWNKKYLGFREAKKSVKNFLPQFNCLYDFDDQELQKDTLSMDCPETSEITDKAEEGI